MAGCDQIATMTALPPSSLAPAPAVTTAITEWPRPGTSLAYALATAPSAQRDKLRFWLRWWHEVSQIPLAVSDPSVAETKLRWWIQEVQDASQDQAHHPLLKAWLASPAGTAPLPDWPLWLQQLDGLLTLAQQTRWLDEASLLRQADLTTGAACEGAAQLLGADTPAARQAARQLGQGLRLAHQLARLGQDARLGWVHVAIDVLQAHQVRAHELSKPTAQAPEGLPKLLSHLHQQARQAIQQGLTAIAALPADQAKALRPLRVLAHVQLRQMMAIEASGERVLHERTVLTPLRKSWIARQVRWGWLA